MTDAIPRKAALTMVGGMLAIVAILALMVFMISKASAPSDLKAGEALQKVNNQAALKHIDERLATMSGPEKVNYLALQACAIDISTYGVYGMAKDNNPLLLRLGALNDRYNVLYKQLGTVLPLPDNLHAAEDRVCPHESLD